MRRLTLLAAIIAIGIMGWGISPAMAYLIDGSLLSDWGVTPFSDWDPDPASADWVEGDGTRPSGGAPLGGEPYDVEALYFDDDGEYAYFAMVNSYHLGDSLAGDLGIDTNADGDYDYGIDISGLALGSSSAEVWKDPSWWSCICPVYMTSGTDIGDAELAYVNAGALEGAGQGDTYILEGRVSRFLFNPLPQQGTTADLHWALTCGNDYIDLSADFDNHTVPEPGSLLLMGSGLFGLAGLGLKKLRRRG